MGSAYPVGPRSRPEFHVTDFHRGSRSGVLGSPGEALAGPAARHSTVRYRSPSRFAPAGRKSFAEVGLPSWPIPLLMALFDLFFGGGRGRVSDSRN